MKVSLAMEMENGKQLKDNRQIYLNIPANSKPFFALSFFVNYSFAPLRGFPFCKDSLCAPVKSVLRFVRLSFHEWNIMQVIFATLWKNMKSAKYIYDLFCPQDKGPAHKKAQRRRPETRAKVSKCWFILGKVRVKVYI